MKLRSFIGGSPQSPSSLLHRALRACEHQSQPFSHFWPSELLTTELRNLRKTIRCKKVGDHHEHFYAPAILAQLIWNSATEPGIEHVGGDIVKSVPKADVHFLKWILHRRNDEFCVKVLKNCWEALPPTRKVVIVEVVIPENLGTDKLSQSSFFVDVNMLRISPGRKDRTWREYADLACASGFHTPKYVLRAYNMWLIDLRKKI